MTKSKSSRKVIIDAFTAQVSAALETLGASGRRVLATVSGGPDSTALLRSLVTLRRRKRLDVAAAHANHALRGEDSDGDEQFVRSLCDRLKIPLCCRRLPVPLDSRDRDEGIEATARELRQQFFAEAARELDSRFIATAHTADDQAETVLHRIIRGTGLAGLAGIPRARTLVPGVKLIRPMLRLSRTDVRNYLAAVGQDFREDRSNLDYAFTRNRLRHELIPYLAKHFNLQVGQAINRLAMLAGESQSVMDDQVTRLARRAVVKQTGDTVVLRVAPLRRSPRFIVCELLRRLWADRSWPLQEVGYEELARVAELVARDAGAWDLPDGVRARRTPSRIILERAPTRTECR